MKKIVVLLVIFAIFVTTIVVVGQGSHSASTTINIGYFKILAPYSNGTNSQWLTSPSESTAASCVSDNWLSPDDSDYIYLAAPGTCAYKSDFIFDTWTGSEAIARVSVCIRVKVDSGSPAGTNETDLEVYYIDSGIHGVEEVDVTSTFQNRTVNYDLNPSTSLAWTQADISQSSWGVRPSCDEALADELQVSMIYLKIIPDTSSVPDTSPLTDYTTCSIPYDFVQIMNWGLCTTEYLGIYFAGIDFEIIPEYATSQYPNSRMRWIMSDIGAGDSWSNEMLFGASGYDEQMSDYPWVVSEQDNYWILNDPTLSFDDDGFTMYASVYAYQFPSSGTYSVLTKPGNYSLYLNCVTSPPQFVFKVFGQTPVSGVNSYVSIDSVEDRWQHITAWYDPVVSGTNASPSKIYISSSAGGSPSFVVGQSELELNPGSLTVNNNNLTLMEFTGLFDDLAIFTNINVGSRSPSGLITKLVYSAFPGSLAYAACSEIITVQTQDFYSSPVSVVSDTGISISGSEGEGSFFSLTCSGAPITAATITAGNNSVSFRYESHQIGEVTIVSADDPSQDWTNASQDLEVYITGTVTQLAYSVFPGTVAVDTCSTAIIVQAQDRSGSPYSLGSAVTLSLTNSGSGNFYAVSNCSGGTIASIGISSGNSSSDAYYFECGSPGTRNFTAAENPSKGWTDAVQEIEAIGGGP